MSQGSSQHLILNVAQDKAGSSTRFVVVAPPSSPPLASPSSWQSTPSPEVEGPPTTSSVEPEYALKPVGLLRLLQQRKLSVLLVDCRDGESFNKLQINHAGCVNVFISGDRIANCEGFATKADVVKFLQTHCPGFLLRLQVPGHYSRVVVVDQGSTVERCSKLAKVMLEALILWNQSTKTLVNLLQGGVLEFEKAYSFLMLKCVDLGAPSEDDLQDQGILPPVTIPETCSVEQKEVLTSFVAYLAFQDKVIGILRQLIKWRVELQTLEGIGGVLKVEMKQEEQGLSKLLESRIPEDVMCPVCLEVYTGEILQCANGHSVCGKCGGALATCPECRVGYQSKVRNRALEKLLQNALQVKCVCGEVELKVVGGHAKLCAERRYGEALKKLEEDVEGIRSKIDKENESLWKVKTEMLLTESRWNKKISQGDRIANPESDTWNKFFNNMSAKNMTIELLNRKLFPLIFGD